MVEDAQHGSASGFRIAGSPHPHVEDLYTQLNALLMQGEDWELGASLHALHDALYRFGLSAGIGPTVFV